MLAACVALQLYFSLAQPLRSEQGSVTPGRIIFD